MNWLKKILIKDYASTEKAEVRIRYGTVAAVIGIISNVVLFAFKLLVGILGSSITIMADAVNNLSDAGSSVVTLVGFRLSGRPADKQHPYGHARYEYISALVVAVIVLIIGVLLCKSSVEKIISPVVTTVTVFTYVVLCVAIVLKIVQMLIYRDFSKSIKNYALRASSCDSRNDVIATTVVLISTIVIDTTGVNIDGYMGIAVSLFIVISAIMLIRDTINPLIGAEPDRELVDKIRTKIFSYTGVIGMHDLMIHNYGATACFVIAHVEVDAKVPIMESHDMVDNIEHDFWTEFNIHLNIHIDPIDLDDEERGKLEERAKAVLKGIESDLTLHDFRIVRGSSHTNLLFDVVIPFESNVSLSSVKDAMEKEFNSGEKKYFFVIEEDR